MDVTSLHGRHATDRWNRVSVGDLFERVRWSYPDKEAIVARGAAVAYEENRRLTYTQADELANRIANALLARGLERGDRVLLFCENSVEAFLTKFGIAKAGLTAVPVNPMLAPDVIAHVIAQAKPRFSFVDAELWAACEAGFAQESLTPDVTIPVGGGVVPGSLDFRDFVAGASTDEPDVAIHGDDIWEIVFTSGTTAMPKGAMISHHYSYFGAFSFALTLTRGLTFECDLVLCSFLPLVYHIADQVFSLPAFLSGGTLVIGRRPHWVEIVEAIHEERATALWGGAPAMLEELVRVLDAPGAAYDTTCLTTAIYGWTAPTPKLVADLKRHCGQGFLPCEILGQTEAISCYRFWPDKWRETFDRTAPEQNYVGVPNPLLASDLFDADNRSLHGTVGVPGEAVYRSPAVFQGYYRDEDATRLAFRGGWFHSGDLCVYDEDGLRIMVDRSKDMIKSGGENVSTIRVEAVLHQHPAVAKSAVVGLPHEHWGEAVTAIVMPVVGQTVDPEDVIAFCRTRLAGFETPKHVVVVNALPVTVGGKVLKHLLRAEHATLYDGQPR
jgi:acyl-CoA synthetase (AMP-forming)/AMP-acid ligase II